ncbi:hypothetical protein IHE45_10G014300 [Dioscorea alata]|uniref:Uncharacterized protein n=1 Tax=Dioscorea alata TaxID=55571 RepID=A0ACB7V951_DIOAL|nr:hypothetical protein IHE45_10G014300 [Dioscorea alata]
MRHEKEHYSKAMDEVCELLLRFIDFSPAKMPRMTPAGLVSLLLGCSLALMLCGFVTFRHWIHLDAWGTGDGYGVLFG